MPHDPPRRTNFRPIGIGIIEVVRFESTDFSQGPVVVEPLAPGIETQSFDLPKLIQPDGSVVGGIGRSRRLRIGGHGMLTSRVYAPSPYAGRGGVG